MELPVQLAGSPVFTDIWIIVTSVVTIASVIVKLTPSDWDNKFLSKVIRILSLAPKK